MAVDGCRAYDDDRAWELSEKRRLRECRARSIPWPVCMCGHHRGEHYRADGAYVGETTIVCSRCTCFSFNATGARPMDTSVS